MPGGRCDIMLPWVRFEGSNVQMGSGLTPHTTQGQKQNRYNIHWRTFLEFRILSQQSPALALRCEIHCGFQWAVVG